MRMRRGMGREEGTLLRSLRRLLDGLGRLSHVKSRLMARICCVISYVV